MNGIDLAGLRLMAIGTLSVLAAAGVVVVLDNGPEETPSPVTTTLRPTTTTSTSSTSTSSTSTSTSTSTSISVFVADAPVSCSGGFAVAGTGLAPAELVTWLDDVEGVKGVDLPRLFISGDLCGGGGEETVVVGPFEEAIVACQVLVAIEQARPTGADGIWKVVEGFGDDDPPPLCGAKTGGLNR